MNKLALKNFATNARKELIEKVKAKAFKIGITEENIKRAQFESSDSLYIDGKQLSATEKKQREKLISRINEIGYNQVVEEVAYTWFNRFTALRFMEVNNYLPTKVRVLSSSNVDSSEPDIIKEALTVELEIDKELVYDLKLNNQTDELFKYLVIKQCNGLNKVLPFMFETIDDYKEILFPEGLLAKDSFLRQMTDTQVIPETDWEQVEIIGWLYQYYIAEEKDRVIKAKKKYKTEEIPFATQLFTPDWIVRYMVQNTLGRYWVESHSEHQELIKNWEFYLNNPNQEPDFEVRLAPYLNKELKVEDIKCFDPAMGSGHILIYMFDVLYEIYCKCGYMEREIPRLIIENNLYGLDIDDRAYQLACFSLVMKALEYNNRFLRSVEKEPLQINLASIQETNLIHGDEIAYIAGEKNGKKFENTKGFIEQCRNAKSLGSLLKIKECDVDFYKKRLDFIKNNPAKDLFEVEVRDKVLTLLPQLIHQIEIVNNQYDIIVTNPPYMGSKYMNLELSNYVKENYPDTKFDIFSAFIEMCSEKVYIKGHLGFVTPYVWMFISSYENLRKSITTKKSISSLIQLEYNSFPGVTVPVCCFTFRNTNVNIRGEYIRLSDFPGVEVQKIKTIEAIKDPSVDYRYSEYTKSFLNIPRNIVAYWLSENMKQTFNKADKLSKIAEPKKGMFTSDNLRFVRLWSEVDINKFHFPTNEHINLDIKSKKWFPYNNGGKYRKWYGNNEDVVNWENDGEEIKAFERSGVVNPKYNFNPGLTWTAIGSSKLSVRDFGYGFLFSSAGGCIFTEEKYKDYINAFINSKVSQVFLSILSPTMNFNPGDLAELPIILDESKKDYVCELVNENISISKKDWDSYEFSFDFSNHPILTCKKNHTRIEDVLKDWVIETENRFNKLKRNEEELNRVFIDVYGLQNEIDPMLVDDDITISKAEGERDIKSFISYAIGCMFGRFSLDEEGLVYAGGEFQHNRYQKFEVDKDNILPILTGAYFDDDIVSKFIEFVKGIFGEEMLAENLEYIARLIGKKKGEIAKETIRRYLLNDFFFEHLQTYKKKPIYWLFTSGKQKAFNCLIYMHRYDKSTLSRIRTDYLHELQMRMDAEKKTLLDIINGDGTTKEIANAKKELKSLDLKIEELRAYDEKLHHMADMQIEIDLDDGVAVNYAKFEGLLAPIK
ncbi:MULTISPECIES: BREX-1 system adenine-specific DNA-methyltransferase PglX [unclassified Paenibacillus]|uniref:BREX-1 system adenine-specific DNA-methyltransferase PglX n=1 Tax=unclassified Paenibacillus TaxID=185978 RepID=UPI001AE68F2F|nr:MULTISPECIES: BREX-1 system adenine-specific DNA-methyltransferase PglX [unclassified Paenibacillus]MBP1153945.1 type II restriction/modification system DNA methylase subunit YeeA [Paenibacillus sp. PvP091]MBP1170670.1 type II restriction/modification system DNA methylase subunit YeeA [Paenibacillus sp. PvR098]MBP2441698.1 type II restriction/modification system DNA methylase subunit YeeA [Paenibacillus sp. PvP052]